MVSHLIQQKKKEHEIIASFDTFAVGELNITYVFNKRVQQEDKTF